MVACITQNSTSTEVNRDIYNTKIIYHVMLVNY